jgi:carbon-monoxide dehydrogenase small subunit
VLHPIQESFRECHALQCGFCTPGFLTTIAAGLDARRAAGRDTVEITDEEVDDLVGGNLCRCTGYANIKKACRHAAATMREGAEMAISAQDDGATR